MLQCLYTWNALCSTKPKCQQQYCHLEKSMHTSYAIPLLVHSVLLNCGHSNCYQISAVWMCSSPLDLCACIHHEGSSIPRLNKSTFPRPMSHLWWRAAVSNVVQYIASQQLTGSGCSQGWLTRAHCYWLRPHQFYCMLLCLKDWRITHVRNIHRHGDAPDPVRSQVPSHRRLSWPGQRVPGRSLLDIWSTGGSVVMWILHLCLHPNARGQSHPLRESFYQRQLYSHYWGFWLTVIEVPDHQMILFAAEWHQ